MILETVQAVVDVLNSKSWSVPFTAVSVAVPDVAASDLGQLTVLVCPGATEISRETRGSKQHEMRVDIGLLKNLGRQRTDTVQALVNLMEEIADYFLDNPLATATVISVAMDPLFDPEALRGQNGRFQSAIQLNLLGRSK
jgi:hypothetical protein